MLPRSRAPIAFPSPWSGDGKRWGNRQGLLGLHISSPSWPGVTEREVRGKCPGAQPWPAKRREVLWVGFPLQRACCWVAEGMGRGLPHKRQVRDRYTARRCHLPVTPSTYISPHGHSGKKFKVLLWTSLVKVALLQHTAASGRKGLPCPFKMKWPWLKLQ